MKDLIIVAHGWSLFADPTTIPLSKHLASEVCDTVRVKYSNNPNRSIAEMATSTKVHIDNYRKIYDKIIWVGHSMGAVIGAQIMKMDNDAFDGFVSLGGPLRGSRGHLDWLGSMSISVEEMKNSSSLMRTLPTKSPVPSLGISATFDPLVSQYSAESYCHDKQMVPWTTHLSMVFSRRVFLETSAWISYEVLGYDPTEQSFSGDYSSLSISSSS